MAKLIIARNSQWMNRARSIKIYADDNQIGDISNGDVKEFELEPGLHTIRAKIDWAGSRDVPIMIAENEVKTLFLSGFKYSQGMVIVSGLSTFLYFITHIFFFLLPGIIGFFLMGYYVTIGRKDYLVLRDTPIK